MKTSPKDFFLHLGVIATLYTIAISFINLAWRIVDNIFPEDVYYFFERSISGPVATLIIVFPVFLVLSWLINKEYKKVPEKKELWVRKWLIYITLFVAGIVIIVDLIIVLISFLSGEIITTGFILKSLSVLIVALAIFYYYISDLRGKISSKSNKIYALVTVIVVVGLIIAGFSIIGSPRTQRLLNYDDQKISDLQNIQWQIIDFWQSKGKLPQNLLELSDSISGFKAPLDSQTKNPYKYEITGNLSFELCAEFNLPSQDTYSNSRAKTLMYPGAEDDNWQHGEGEHCFERTIDPERYPVHQKTTI